MNIYIDLYAYVYTHVSYHKYFLIAHSNWLANMREIAKSMFLVVKFLK
jgi:hypothetical protein